MYVDPITRQTYDYATSFACDNIPKNINELDPDSDDQDFYNLGPEPIKRKPPLMFTPSQIKLQYVLTLSQLKMLAYILMLNFINFGREFYFRNILIPHFNFGKNSSLLLYFF